MAGHWVVAVALMFLERMGKAMRNPARDAMLSFAGKQMGRGWGFALHEAMDQVGATIGPLIVAAAVYLHHSYRTAFAWLVIPALLSLAVLPVAVQLAVARMQFPHPARLESKTPQLDTHGYASPFWLYLAATGCVAAGFADFPLLAYHFQKVGTVQPEWIPILYAIAMGTDAIAALIFGYLYDRRGMGILLAGALLAVPVAPLVFFGNFDTALLALAELCHVVEAAAADDADLDGHRSR